MFDWWKLDSKKPKSLGQQGEEFAQLEYKKLGYNIVTTNFFNKRGLRKGEVDFIATMGNKIVFVEVKTRKFNTGKFGSGAEAVSVFKQRKILKAVKIFLQQNPKYLSFVPQIDVCVVIYNEFDKNTFSATILANAVEDYG